MKRISLIIVLTFFFTSFVQSQEKKYSKSKMNIQDEKKSFNEIKEVAKALEPYIRSAKTGDGELSVSNFFDHARIVGSINGAFYNMTTKEFSGAIKEDGASEKVESHIAWIDVSGPAAAAKVDFIDWNGLRFTDFFVLYKRDGEWKISGKVYDSHSNN